MPHVAVEAFYVTCNSTSLPETFSLYQTDDPPQVQQATPSRVALNTLLVFADESKDKQRSMEDELKDPKYFLEYLLPRPIRLAFFGASGFGCFIALVLGVAAVSADGLQVSREQGTLVNLGINALGLAMFAGLILVDCDAVLCHIQSVVVREVTVLPRLLLQLAVCY